jgi:hypothetical protein
MLQVARATRCKVLKAGNSKRSRINSSMALLIRSGKPSQSGDLVAG